MFMLTITGIAAAAPACSPTNYTKMTNSGPAPADFCAYSYLPFRARIPEHPQWIDQANTAILRQQYAANSGSGRTHPQYGQLTTLGRRPTGPNMGNSGYPVYVASSTDPLVSVNCAVAVYGCSVADWDTTSTVPSFRIPAWARPSSNTQDPGDANMEIIQPNGVTVGLNGCRPGRDWRNGDVIGTSLCTRFGGIAFSNIVTGTGVNPGNLNGGTNYAEGCAQYAR